MKLNLLIMSVLILSCSLVTAQEAPQNMTITPSSPRAGFIFMDSEPIEMSAKVNGITAPATVEFLLKEYDGGVVSQGQIALENLTDGAGEISLPLDINGKRGLYVLSLTLICGENKTEANTNVAVVFTPDPVDESSPWGIFYIPLGWVNDAGLEKSAEDAAFGHRLLGASWTRFNFWAGTIGKVTITPGDNPQVSGDWGAAHVMVDALRRHGIFIMGEIAQCPRELSSQQDALDVSGDAGPIYNRVKPADYALWDQLMTKLAADFKDEIKVWEIWNEVNLINHYWTGTVEDLAVHIHHTAEAFRKGNPEARIAAAGFVGGHDYADKLFQLGMGNDIDILTVHYTDDTPSWIGGWEELLAKHNLNIPIWNSEERSEIPLRNINSPIERSFKFCHVFIGYEDFRPLINQDLTARPSGIAFSVGAKCIGNAKHTGEISHKVPGYQAHFLRRGDEEIVAFENRGNALRLFSAQAEVILKAEALNEETPVTITDLFGRSTQVPVVDGQCTVTLTGTSILNGAKNVELVKANSNGEAGMGVYIAEAEDGRLGPGWFIANHDGFSNGKTIDLWADSDPGPDGFWVEVPFYIPEDGSYDVLFSGNSLRRLEPPRSLSPFSWQIDGGEKLMADTKMPVEHAISGSPEGLATLGTVNLSEGDHIFRLQLTGRRDEPDQNYAMWFDALAFRKR